MLGLWYILGIAVAVAVSCIIASHISWATGTNRMVAETTRDIARSISKTSRYATASSTRRPA